MKNNYNDNLKGIFQKTHDVRLSAEERTQQRDVLLSHIQSGERIEDTPGRIPQQRSFVVYAVNMVTALYKKPMTTLALTLVIAIAAGSGTTLAAENSLPGDTLYPVKVNVTENVRSVLAFSNEAEAELAVELAERRIQEAEQLTAEGTLSSEAKTMLELNFDLHNRKLEKNIQELEEQGKADVAARLAAHYEATLNAHDRILVFLTTRENVEAQNFAAKIRTHIAAAKNLRVEAEEKTGAQTNAQSAAEGRLQATQNKIEQTERFMATKEDKVSAEAKTQAEANVADAKEVMAEGQAALEAGNYNEAFLKFQEAHRIAQESHVSINVSSRLGLPLIEDKNKEEENEDDKGEDDKDEEERDETDEDSDESEDQNTNEDEDSDNKDDDDEDNDDEDEGRVNIDTQIKGNVNIKTDL